jgi:hypothetical protein
VINFSEKDWVRIQDSWKSWWEGDLNRPLVVIEVPGGPSLAAHRFAASYPIDMPADEVIAVYDRALAGCRWYGDAWPRWFPNLGPGIMAGFLGANVRPAEDTVWFGLQKPSGMPETQPKLDWNNPWWKRVEELTLCAVQYWGNQVCVGLTDIGGNLDVLASLRGTEKLLMDIVDAPKAIIRLSKKLTRLWLQYYRRLYGMIAGNGRGATPWAHIWSPGPCYMLQSDISCMLSPQTFDRLVLPDLDACCRSIEYAFYHLDGPGAILHLDKLLSLKNLRGIQWIPGDGAPPPENWLSLLSKIRAGGKLCQVYVTGQGARTIVSELGGKGFALAIRDVGDEAEAQGLLRELGI